MTELYEPVPPSYRGVWRRALLETPEGSDNSTFVRWMQLQRWHADIRIPTAARVDMPARPLADLNEKQVLLLASQQGFCGVTEVSRDAAGRALCTWHRQVDYQPPRAVADTGEMVFETPDCVIETGIHGVYREVWHRLPDSAGPLIVLQALDAAGQPDARAAARLLMAGHYLMRVVPHNPTGPNFEISFGRVKDGYWTIEQSTLPALEGQKLACAFQRLDPDRALVSGDLGPVNWSVLEWSPG